MSNASDFVIEKGVLKKYVGSGGDVVIPEDVTSIFRSAFCGCESLRTVTIPGNVEVIGEEAFINCKGLEKAVIAEGVKKIGFTAFGDCINLKSLILPERTLVLGYMEFDLLKSADIPEKTLCIHCRAFSGCMGLYDKNGLMIIADTLCGCVSKNANVVVPEGTIKITEGALFNCVVATLPASIRFVDEGAFSYNGKLKKVFVPNELVISTTAFPKGIQFVVKKPDTFFKTADARCADFVDDSMIMTAEDLAYVWLFQSGQKWKEIAKTRTKNPADVLSAMAELYVNVPSLPEPKTKGLIDFLTSYAEDLGASTVRAFLDQLGKTWPAVVGKVKKDKYLAEIL